MRQRDCSAICQSAVRFDWELSTRTIVDMLKIVETSYLIDAVMKRTMIRWKDQARYSPTTGRLALAGARVKIPFMRDDIARADLLMQAYRRTENPWQRATILQKVKPYLDGARGVIWRDARIGWSRYPRAMASPLINRSISSLRRHARTERRASCW